MNKIFLIAFLIFAMQSFADEVDNTFGGASSEFEYVKYSDEYIQLQISHDMQIACKKSLCTLFAVTNDYKDFSIEFMIGAGNVPINGNSNGGVVVVGGSTSTEPGPFVGLTMKMSVGTCTQKVKVPTSLYIAMNTFLYNLINEDGTPKSGLTPADEAMLMFYTTIMKQASGCK